MKILLIDDDPQITSFVKMGLEENNYYVDIAYDGSLGENLALNKKFDVIILDVVLPGLNGYEVLKRIRNNNIKTPVLMLTSLDSTDNKVTGFDYGADDYLVKPFIFKELLARIKALYRRSQETMVNPLLKISDLEVDTVTKCVKRNNESIKLTTREYKILELLLSNKGRVFERIEIAEKIWGYSFNSGTNVIDVHINSLRNKIDKNFSPKLIHTIIGMGYVISDER
jgi:two-component system, OmpR family, copper resistance phosphate regulon response regulator CusR